MTMTSASGIQRSVQRVRPSPQSFKNSNVPRTSSFFISKRISFVKKNSKTRKVSKSFLTLTFFPIVLPSIQLLPRFHKGEKERQKRFFHCFDPFCPLSFRQ